jgi:hypothetical protein
MVEVTYLHHAALNLGVALSALWWGALPPSLHHSPEERRDLARGSALAWFAWGLGVSGRP